MPGNSGVLGVHDPGHALVLSFPKVIFASRSVSLTLAAGCGLRLPVFRASEAHGRFKR